MLPYIVASFDEWCSVFSLLFTFHFPLSSVCSLQESPDTPVHDCCGSGDNLRSLSTAPCLLWSYLHIRIDPLFMMILLHFFRFLSLSPRVAPLFWRWRMWNATKIIISKHIRVSALAIKIFSIDRDEGCNRTGAISALQLFSIFSGGNCLGSIKRAVGRGASERPVTCKFSLCSIIKMVCLTLLLLLPLLRPPLPPNHVVRALVICCQSVA